MPDKIGKRGKRAKRDNLSFDEVAQVCEKLMTDGEKVTVRNVLAVTGGGFATVSDFIKQWQEQQVVSDATDLPKTLITALKTAYKSMLSEQEASYQQKLNLEAQHTREALDQVTLLEKTTAELQNELEKCQHATTSKIMALEKELSISALRLEDSHKREQKIADELSKIRQKLHEVEIQMAVLKTKRQKDKKTEI
ncbi:DNA-binding protein [Cysteiniphilum litorale]|uniref:DNA-binding protein n=1 Tax=Cysteiniphilum litorale TaxID=2056700 RepID=UPI003F880C16